MTVLAVDMLAAVRAVGGDVKLVGPGRLKVEVINAARSFRGRQNKISIGC
jgi:hypothetical protein